MTVKGHESLNAVKITGEDIIVKDTKTAAGDRHVYFSPEMESLRSGYASRFFPSLSNKWQTLPEKVKWI